MADTTEATVDTTQAMAEEAGAEVAVGVEVLHKVSVEAAVRRPAQEAREQPPVLEGLQEDRIKLFCKRDSIRNIMLLSIHTVACPIHKYL